VATGPVRRLEPVRGTGPVVRGAVRAVVVRAVVVRAVVVRAVVVRAVVVRAVVRPGRGDVARAG
jgi:hypothetical protein